MPDLRKLQNDAVAAISAGDLASAIGCYVALEKAAPGEGTWSLRLGECLRKLGREAEAVGALTRALTAYARRGMRNKAVAVCKLILEIDPRNPRMPSVLAWLTDPRRAEATPEPEPAPPPPSEPSAHDTSEFQVPASMRKVERAQMLKATAESAAVGDPALGQPGKDPALPARPLPRVVLPRTPFFSAMNERQLRMVNERAHLVEVAAGQILFAQGERADALFVVASGEIAVLVPQEVTCLGRGDTFGEEVAVLPRHPRMATVRASAASQVLALERDLVAALVAEAPALVEVLTESLRARLLRTLACTSPMLAALPEPDRAAWLARFHCREVDKDRPICEPGEPDGGLWVLLAGDAVATLDGRLTDVLQTGDVFGEIALLTHTEVSLTATAREKCFVLELPQGELEELRTRHPAVLEYLTALAESRLERLRQAAVQDGPGVRPSRTAMHALLIHADLETRRAYERALVEAGFLVGSASDPESVLGLIAQGRFDVVLCDLGRLSGGGVALLGTIRQRDLDVPIILTMPDHALDTTNVAASYGVVDSFVEPVALADLVGTASRAAHLHRLTRLRREAMSRLNPSGEWMGDLAGLEFHFGSTLPRLWMAFQPIVSAQARNVFAFEALLRSGAECLRSPAAVLRAAERLHRVHDVGRLIRDSVAATAAQLAAPPTLFVNLHGQDLADQHLLDPRSRLSSLAPQVILEVTERSPLDELGDLRSRLRALRSLGYRFAIDNLGAGYASVASLAQLEPDVAKLDLSLVRDIDRDQVKQDLVRAMLEVCRDMNVQVICGGVETASERDTLLHLGADFMQGYLFARPGPPFPSVDLSTLPHKK
jgi:cAMP-dependent protein kinase regulator